MTKPSTSTLLALDSQTHQSSYYMLIISAPKGKASCQMNPDYRCYNPSPSRDGCVGEGCGKEPCEGCEGEGCGWEGWGTVGLHPPAAWQCYRLVQVLRRGPGALPARLLLSFNLGNNNCISWYVNHTAEVLWTWTRGEPFVVAHRNTKPGRGRRSIERLSRRHLPGSTSLMSFLWSDCIHGSNYMSRFLHHALCC